MVATITGRIDPEILKARMEQARLDKPEVLKTIRKFGKMKREKMAAAIREERRVASGKFNAIKMKEDK